MKNRVIQARNLVDKLKLETYFGNYREDHRV